MSFSLLELQEETIGSGNFASVPLTTVFEQILSGTVTGVLSVGGEATQNKMFFMRGQPVGVELSGLFHPLGQLLLEQGLVDAETFLQAQRRITAQSRLPGQVFKELGALDDESLKKILIVQARKKIGHFCTLGTGDFSFGRGLTFLTGFNPAPLDMHAAIFLSIERTFSVAERKAYLYEMSRNWVKISRKQHLLPSSLEAYGFGPPEEKFLKRVKKQWHEVTDLIETGTLTDLEVAVLLKYLTRIEWIKVSKTRPEDIGETERTPVAPPAQQSSISSIGRPKFGGAAGRPFKSAGRSPLGGQRTIASPARAPAAAAVRPPPNRNKPDPIHQEPTFVKPIPQEPEPKKPDSKPRPAMKTGKKKRTRRTEPEPSIVTTTETETRREKTDITPLPSILIDD